jgi:hypothetical protein
MSTTADSIRFHREADGTYVAEVGPAFATRTVFGGNEFGAMVWQDGGEWRVRVTTFGRLLEELTVRSLEAGKARVRQAFTAIEG